MFCLMCGCCTVHRDQCERVKELEWHSSALEKTEFRCNLVNYISGCASDCMHTIHCCSYEQSKVDVEVWMMTSKLFDQPYGTVVFINHHYTASCMGQTLIKGSMVSKNHSWKSVVDPDGEVMSIRTAQCCIVYPSTRPDLKIRNC